MEQRTPADFLAIVKSIDPERHHQLFSYGDLIDNSDYLGCILAHVAQRAGILDDFIHERQNGGAIYEPITMRISDMFNLDYNWLLGIYMMVGEYGDVVQRIEEGLAELV